MSNPTLISNKALRSEYMKDIVKITKNNLNKYFRDDDKKKLASIIDKSPATIYRYLNYNNDDLPSINNLNILSEFKGINLIEFFK